MQRTSQPCSTVRYSLAPKDARAIRRVAGIAAALIAAIMVWRGSDGLLQTTMDLWHHAVLPAFHALLISGLGLCS